MEKKICNFTNSVQISFIQTLKVIVFSWTIWWCWRQNVLMNNEKNIFFYCELAEWPLICRDLYQHRWMGDPDATPDLWKQPFSAVRASGGYPGNVVRGIHRWPVNSPHKGQHRGKCFHLMTSSWHQSLGLLDVLEVRCMVSNTKGAIPALHTLVTPLRRLWCIS